MLNTYSPKEFGKLIGRTTNTLQKWDREGRLKAYRSPTNRRYYTHEQYLTYRGLVAPEQGRTVAYARVSGVAQKPDLAKQIKALKVYCDQHSIKVDEWMQDIGSGLNYKRKHFNRLEVISNPSGNGKSGVVGIPSYLLHHFCWSVANQSIFFKEHIKSWIMEDHCTNCEVILERLQKAGYTGGISILKEFVHRLRPAVAGHAPVQRYETDCFDSLDYNLIISARAEHI